MQNSIIVFVIIYTNRFITISSLLFTLPTLLHSKGGNM